MRVFFCDFRASSFIPSSRNVNLIVGGRLIPITEAPFQAAIYLGGLFHCGGVVIAPRWVLTAGHCVVYDDGGVIEANHYAVQFGTDNANVHGEMEASVEALFLHPEFTLRPLDYDAALMKLSVLVQFSDRVRCIPMALSGTPAVAGEIVFVTGYGRNRPEDILSYRGRPSTACHRIDYR
ncbi:AGAP008276-PA-like protein [Anopheles sinensis]|uniref:AGAP008276-PA-like protein n=1 Tax=Anopheles sinensis TaxID=74873 RepID=A0A084VY26_ANOSI|nr:AGAP008276-PA-like protein [Anopheles sinensis]